jgi:hypothetical protein
VIRLPTFRCRIVIVGSAAVVVCGRLLLLKTERTVG